MEKTSSKVTSVDEFCRRIGIYENYKQVNGIYVHNDLFKKLDQKIYRYTSFEYLLSMIKTGKLYISRRTKFDDKREIGRKQNLRYTFPFSPVEESEELQKESARISYECWRRFHNSFVSCWTYGFSEGDSAESYLMWKAYGNKGVGCRLGTTVRGLIESIKVDENVIVLLGDVNYITKERIADNSLEHNVFEKDICFSDERELRLCIIDNFKTDKETHICADSYLSKIDVDKLIQEIVISPFISNNYAKFHKEQFQQQFPEYSNLIKDSSLLL